jgi:hypothetical protein
LAVSRIRTAIANVLKWVAILAVATRRFKQFRNQGITAYVALSEFRHGRQRQRCGLIVSLGQPRNLSGLKARFTSERYRLSALIRAFSACYSCDQNPGALPQAKVEIAPLALNVSNRDVLDARKPSFLGLQCLPSAQEDFPTGTELEHFAPATVRLARIATAAPMPDEPVTPVCPMLPRHELH